MVEFDRKTLAIIGVVAVIIIAIFVYAIVLLGNPTSQGPNTEEYSNVCLLAPFTAQNSGTVNAIEITLLNYQVSGGSSGTLYLGLYDSTGNLITSGSSSLVIPYNGVATNYSVSTVTQPVVTQGV